VNSGPPPKPPLLLLLLLPAPAAEVPAFGPPATAAAAEAALPTTLATEMDVSNERSSVGCVTEALALALLVAELDGRDGT
jgi:hypothetical protein